MKRLICLMLTLIMLVSLVPTAAISAEAADRSISEAAITVLKNMMKFQKNCYPIEGTNDFRVGYGTPCTKSHKPVKDENGLELIPVHTVSQNTADKALRDALKDVEKKVNSFGSSNKLSLKQYQFDSLTVFSYLYGTAWMNGNGVLKTAILNGADTADMLYAMEAVSKNLDRSKILVNMYKNNVYTNDLPGNYVSITYHANGGHMAQGDTFTTYFNSDHESSHQASATRNGYKFLGWYNTKGKYYSNLRTSIADGQLYAYWQHNSINSSNINDNVNKSEKVPVVSYPISKDSLASRSIFDKPNRGGEKLGKVEADTISVDRDYLSSTGARWARIAGKQQWVQVTGEVDDEDSKPNNTKTIGVTVTNDYVNVREEATIHSKNIGKYNRGEKLYIIKTKNADGFLWGEVAKSKYDPDYGVGWIALMYTNWNSVKDNPDSVFDTDPDDTDSSKVVAKATVTANGYLHVRSGAGTGYGIVGSIAQNETVNVYEIKTVNGHQWGRTSAGWICLTYTDVDMLKGSSDVSNEGSASYTFTGTYDGSLKPFVDASANSNHTEYAPEEGDTVSIITLRKVGDETWAKIGWKETIDKKRVNKYGWVPVSPLAARYTTETYDLSGDTTPVGLNPVKFQVVADQATVRKEAGSGNTSVGKMNKGYQFTVDTIKLVNEEIWGKVATADYNGWVNLASKYAKRADQIKDDSDNESNGTGKVATIVNADVVRVREDSKITAKQVGTLKRGTVANVIKERDGWYKLDVDVDNDPETSSWVYKDYVQISDGSSSGGNLSKPSTTGTGVVANTYAGVNVRSGAGTAYAQVGKLLPGTRVEILETKYVGATKWGRMDKGWVCMDYITMITEMPSEPEKEEAPGTVDNLDDVEKTTTTAVYTGIIKKDGAKVWATTDHDEEKTDLIRELNQGDPVTIYELISVTEKVEPGTGSDGDTTETVTTSYWARTNDGYIRNPEKYIALDALDEKTHTLTGSETLNVRNAAEGDTVYGKLEKGDQVDVTNLEIKKDKVWGEIEFDSENAYNGWIRLDYMSEGAYTQREETTAPPTAPTQPPIGNTGNTGNGGFVNNGGYRYTGKVINTNSVNVRATASTTSAVTTTMSSGQALVIYETTIAENMAWGRCDAGWVYLYYVDLTPCTEGAVDARVVFNDNTIIYSDVNMSETVGTYARMSVVDIYEIVDKMARTDLGWVSTNDLLQ